MMKYAPIKPVMISSIAPIAAMIGASLRFKELFLLCVVLLMWERGADAKSAVRSTPLRYSLPTWTLYHTPSHFVP